MSGPLRARHALLLCSAVMNGWRISCSHSFVLPPKIRYSRRKMTCPYSPASFGSRENDHGRALHFPSHRQRISDKVTPVNLYSSSALASSLLDELNDSQKQAVTQPLQSITRVVAGPGAGKTRVLTSRIAWILQETTIGNSFGSFNEEFSKRPYPPRVLAVTFTKKAASEMQSRLNNLLILIETLEKCQQVQTENINQTHQSKVHREKEVPSGMERVTVGTFHSICSKILRWYGDHLKYLPFTKGSNLDGSFTILDQSEQLRVVKDCMKKVGVSSSVAEGKEQIKPNQVLQQISNIKSNDMGIPSSSDDTEKENQSKSMKRLQSVTRQVYPLYCDMLLKNNAVDFDDLLLFTRDLITYNSTIQTELQKRWEFILVDEFQDTSSVQLDLVSKLVNKSLFVVGDQDQSIYSWRGANMEGMIDGMNKKFEDVRTLYLMENYRSTQNIVKAAQKIIGASNYESSLTHRKKMIPMRGSGATPRIISCADSDAEAEKVIKIIQDMITDGIISAEKGSTVAILYRTNAQSRVIEEECVRKNLRYLVRGNVGTFYTRREIQDCLCFMKFIYNGRDLSSFLRCAKTPSRGIGDVAMKEFLVYCKSNDLSLLDGLLSLSADDTTYEPKSYLSSRALKNFRELSTLFGTVVEAKDNNSMKIGVLLSKVIDTFKLENHFRSICKSSEELNDRMNNVNELRLAAERYSTDLGEFLDDVALLADIDVTDDQANDASTRRVQANLMTIHAAKGMEFDAVFIVGNEQGTFPSQRALIDGQDSVSLAEERRLCYVAMTRAKSNLCLSWRKSVDYFSGQGIATRQGKRSQFLNLLLGQENSKAVEIDNIAITKRNISRRNFSSQHQAKATIFKQKLNNVRDINDLQHVLNNRKEQERHRGGSNKRDDSFDASAYLKKVDSSIFFPIGSKVSHRIHGKGIVMKPLVNDNCRSSLDIVTVKFENGSIYDLPMQGSGLIPIV